MRRDGTLAGLLVALLLVFFWHSLPFAFLSDDYVLLKLANSFAWSHVPPLFATAGGDGFFRPAASLFLGVVAPWALFDPFRWHVLSLALHAANCVLFLRFAGRLGLGPWPAFAAAALFGLHGARPESVVWTAGVFDLLATLFTLLTLLLFGIGRENPGLLRLAASLASMVFALLSKEVAYVIPLLLALLVAVNGPPYSAGLRRMAPYLVAALAVFAWRWSLLGGIGGYLDPGTDRPQVLSFGAISIVKVLLLRLWGPLYFPINWSVEPGLFLGAATVLGVMSYLCLTLARADRRRILFAAAFLLVSVLPACHQLLISATLEKSRLLYLPSVGLSLLIATVVEALPRTCLRLAVGAGLLAFHSTALHHNLAIWSRVARLADGNCATAAEAVTLSTRRMAVRNLPGSLDGVYFFRNGFRECVELRSGRSLEVVELSDEDALPHSSPTTLVLLWDARRRQLVRQPSRSYPSLRNGGRTHSAIAGRHGIASEFTYVELCAPPGTPRLSPPAPGLFRNFGGGAGGRAGPGVARRRGPLPAKLRPGPELQIAQAVQP